MVTKNTCDRLDLPTSLFIHPLNSNVYFSDVNERKIHKYCPISSEVTLIASIQSYNGDPKSIFVSNDEQYLYFTQNHTIRKMDLRTGNNIILAGMENSTGYNGDGKPGQETILYSPTSLRVFEEENEIYFYDVSNDRVRKITNEGIVETVLHLSGYPTFGKSPTQINNCYGKMEICPSKDLLYVSNDSGGLYKFDLATKTANLIITKYNLNEWSLFDGVIYFACEKRIEKIVNRASLPIAKFKGSCKDIKAISHDTAYVFTAEDSVIGFTVDFIGGTHSPFITYNTKRRTKKSTNSAKQRQFMFGNGGAFNIPKSERDLNGALTYFGPLLKKVAPILYTQIQKNPDDVDVYQYLIDYCIYHHYNDFLGINDSLLQRLQHYFSRTYDNALESLGKYVQELSGITEPSENVADYYHKPSKKVKLTEVIPPTFVKEHLQDLFNDESTSDFSIHTKESVWRCHKTIISKSKFFKTLVESASQFIDAKNDAFYAEEGISSTILEIIIKYCYGIQTTTDGLTADEFLELIEMCKIHELDSLGALCIENLNLSLKIFEPLCNFVEKYDSNEFHALRSKLIQFALCNTHDIIENIYGGKLFQLPPFILYHITKELPQWVQFQLVKLK